MNEKKTGLVPTPDELKRQNKRMKKEQKRLKRCKKVEEIHYDPTATPKQMKRYNNLYPKIYNMSNIELAHEMPEKVKVIIMK